MHNVTSHLSYWWEENSDKKWDNGRAGSLGFTRNGCVSSREECVSSIGVSPQGSNLAIKPKEGLPL